MIERLVLAASIGYLLGMIAVILADRQPPLSAPWGALAGAGIAWSLLRRRGGVW